MTESGLLSDDEFAEVARRYVAFCHIDSKVAGNKHPELRTQKKLMGLPSLAFLDAVGTVLVTVPYEQRTVAGVLQCGRRAEEYVRLRAAVAAGDAQSGAPFLRMQLEEGHLELAAAIACRERIGTIADAELRAEIDAMLVDLCIGTELRAVGQKDRHTLGKRFYERLLAGPQPSVRVSRGYHYAMLEWAERERDVVAFGAALADFTRVLAITDPGKPWVAPMLARYRATLAGMEKDRDK